MLKVLDIIGVYNLHFIGCWIQYTDIVYDSLI
jgi:hypothetical protein